MPGRAQQVGTVLAAVVALNRRIAAEPRAPFDGVELGTNQLALLFLLAHHPAPVTPGAAADALGVTRGAVTQLVDGLRGAGLVDSVPHPGDGRSRILRLTDAAGRSVHAYESAIAGRLLPAFDALDDVALATLAELLGRVEARP